MTLWATRDAARDYDRGGIFLWDKKPVERGGKWHGIVGSCCERLSRPEFFTRLTGLSLQPGECVELDAGKPRREPGLSREAVERLVKSVKYVIDRWRLRPTEQGWQHLMDRLRTALDALRAAPVEEEPAPSVAESIEALRAAGGSAWDKVADPEVFLERKEAAPSSPTLPSWLDREELGRAAHRWEIDDGLEHIAWEQCSAEVKRVFCAEAQAVALHVLGKLPARPTLTREEAVRMANGRAEELWLTAQRLAYNRFRELLADAMLAGAQYAAPVPPTVDVPAILNVAEQLRRPTRTWTIEYADILEAAIGVPAAKEMS
ncbi:MAG: hypothetical protein IAF94_08605 [Pirellulaceae bacterium]|nr:hypothetical protein [Pirellulaceae bacterium]